MVYCYDSGNVIMTVSTFTAIVNQLLHEPHAGLLSGMLFGVKATLDTKLFDALVKTGTLHIVALSGMNITLISGIVSTLLLRLISKRLTSLLTIVIIIGFILFVGASPSVVRAGIMGGIALLAIVFGRQLWSLFSLILALGIMLLLNPLQIADLSFQLSALATLGIVLFGASSRIDDRTSKIGVDNRGSKMEVEGRASKIDKIPPSSINYHLPLPSILHHLFTLIEDELRITLAAQVFTVPLIFWYFHRISLVSPVTNVLIGWTIGPVTILGFGAAIAGFLWLPLGYVFAWPAWVLLEYLVRVVTLTSTIPFASVGFD